MTLRWFRPTALLLALLAVFLPQPASAHPADMFIQSQTIYIAPDAVRVDWIISPAPILSQVVWNEADQNNDQVVSPEEALDWAQPRLDDLSASVGESRLNWQLQAVSWPEDFDQFQAGAQVIQLEISADMPADRSGQQQFDIHNIYQEAITINWFHLLGQDGVRFVTPDQQRGMLTTRLWLAGEDVEAPESGGAWLTSWESGTPSVLALQKTVAQTALGEDGAGPGTGQVRSTSSLLTGLIRRQELSLPFYALAIAIAIAIGALHALTPGHGKAVVAAYLVGSQGSARHAVLLGSIVTVTHTGSVLALGLLTLLASQYILPTTVFPILEIVSGLLIVAFGLVLLFRRWGGWRESMLERARIRTSQPQITRYDQAGRARVAINQPVRENGPAHSHDDPSRPDYIPKPAPGTAVTWRSLLALGVSGGLVPCPDAIAILLVAVTINRILLGLSLILTFSLGLAVVLIVVGLMIVRGQRLFVRMSFFNRMAPVMPVISALIVLLLGVALTLGAAWRAGLVFSPSETGQLANQDPDGSSLAEDVGAFSLEGAGILYMARDDQDRNQILGRAVTSVQPQTLTTGSEVWDYSLSPNGKTIAYTALSEDVLLGGQGSDLWTVNVAGGKSRRLLECSDSACSGPVWSPDGQSLVYQKQDLTSPGDALSLTSIWWLDPTTGETAPLFQDGQWPGFNPSWSPDGQWLSYASPGSTTVQTFNVQIYNLEDGRSFSIPNRSGKSVVWSPDSRSVLVLDSWTEEDRYVIHLLHFDLESEELTDLTQASGGTGVEDSWAAWSPDGEQIAVVRRRSSESGVTMGDSLWLMQPDGSQVRQMTDEPDLVHQFPTWSPDSRYLLFQQYRLNQPNPQSETWLLDVTTQDLQKLAVPAHRPNWLPVQAAQSLPDKASPTTGESARLTSLPVSPTVSATPSVTPSPTVPPMPIPTPSGPPTDIYIVQPGDTLGLIAWNRCGCELEELAALNGIDDPASLQVGQALQIPINTDLVGPGARLMPDSEVVYGPSYVDFDVAAFVEEQGGYLSNYSERVDGEMRSGAEVVEMVARNFSVGPRVLLALLEQQAGWVTGDPRPGTSIDAPIASRHGALAGLYFQLGWTAKHLNEGYYGYKQDGAFAFHTDDRQTVVASDGLNAGTVGVQNVMALLSDYEDWEAEMGVFGETYQGLFGDSAQYAIEPLIPADLTQPSMALPWEGGYTWHLAGGPHSPWGDVGPWAALDFAPPDVQGHCAISGQWATAATGGLVLRGQDGQVLLDLDGDGNEQTGWVLFYLHMVPGEDVQPGVWLEPGAAVGHPSCEGGKAESSHLHFARRYNGEWMLADGAVPFVLSGWRAVKGQGPYEGKMVNGAQERVALEVWEVEQNGLVSDNVALED